MMQIPSSILKKRQEQFCFQLKQAGLDQMLISQPVNVTYLTGFTGDSSYAVASPNKIVLVSDRRFEIQIAKECPELEAIIRGPNMTTHQAVANYLVSAKPKSIGIEQRHLTVALYEFFRQEVADANWVITLNWLENQRAIKDEWEIQIIRQSIAIAEEAFLQFRKELKPEHSERDAVSLLEAAIRSRDGDGSAFPIIIGMGDHSALPHAVPTSRKLQEVPFLLVDWGASYQLYCSDLTRVFLSPFRNSRSDENFPEHLENKLRNIYNVVLEAQNRAIAAIRPGVTAKEVDDAARGWIDQQGFGMMFNHGLGHGIGLQIHEAPDIRASSKDVLQQGMIVTMEPGIYLEGFGGVRIEDDILVTPDGHEVLTKLPKDWEEVHSAH